MLPQEVVKKLYLGKYESALTFLDAYPEHASDVTNYEWRLIEALATVFGNPGGGMEGHLGVIVACALCSIPEMKTVFAVEPDMKLLLGVEPDVSETGGE